MQFLTAIGQFQLEKLLPNAWKVALRFGNGGIKLLMVSSRAIAPHQLSIKTQMGESWAVKAREEEN